jgi:cell division protein FtsI (penicillin-binding protein 3)
MKATHLLLGIAASSLFIFPSCKSKTTIDVAMQSTTIELLRDEMKTFGLDSAVVMIVSVQTGEVVVKTKLIHDYSKSKYVEVSDAQIDQPVEPGPIVVPFTVMGVMDQSGYKLDEIVNTGNGRLVLNERTIYDEDVFGRGGYGFIKLERCVTEPSFVGLVQTLESGYQGKLETFISRMDSMSFGAPVEKSPFKDVARFPAIMNAFTLGYSFKMSPTQLITAWNGLANDGKMVVPTLMVGDTGTVNPAMSSKETLLAMKNLLIKNGSRECNTCKDIAFYKSVNSIKTEYKMVVRGTFCGFYPASNPQYTSLVMLYSSAAPDADAKKSKSVVVKAGKSLFFTLSTMHK